MFDAVISVSYTNVSRAEMDRIMCRTRFGARKERWFICTVGGQRGNGDLDDATPPPFSTQMEASVRMLNNKTQQASLRTSTQRHGSKPSPGI